jgi:hypothetical protein
MKLDNFLLGNSLGYVGDIHFGQSSLDELFDGFRNYYYYLSTETYTQHFPRLVKRELVFTIPGKITWRNTLRDNIWLYNNYKI